MKKIFFLILGVFVVFHTKSQQQIDIKNKIDFIIEKKRNNQSITEQEYNFIVSNPDPISVVNALSFYQKDTLDEIRSFVAWKIDLIGDKTNSISVKKVSVEKLLAAIDYEEFKSKYTNIQENIIYSLASYSKNCFSNDSKDIIRSMVRRYNVKSSINLIAGYLELTDLISDMRLKLIKSDSIILTKMKEIRNQKNNNKEIVLFILLQNFSTHLALARMGMKEDIDYCINLAKDLRKIVLPNYFLYDYLKQLAYIRQPEFIDYLKELIYDNNFKLIDADLKLHVGTIDIIQEYFISRNIIDNFPREKIMHGLTDEQKIIFVKKWLKENKGKYKINRDKF